MPTPRFELSDLWSNALPTRQRRPPIIFGGGLPCAQEKHFVITIKNNNNNDDDNNTTTITILLLLMLLMMIMMDDDGEDDDYCYHSVWFHLGTIYSIHIHMVDCCYFAIITTRCMDSRMEMRGVEMAVVTLPDSLLPIWSDALGHKSLSLWSVTRQ